MFTIPKALKQSTSLAALALMLLALADQSRAQNSPALQAGYLYLSPVPGASYVSQQTRYVLVRLSGVDPALIKNLGTDFIQVSGDQTGSHPGTTHIASDGRTVIFETDGDFASNELGSVTLNPKLASIAGGGLQQFTYQFRVTALMSNSLPAQLAPASKAATMARRLQAGQPSPRITSAAPKALGVPRAMRMSNGVSVPSDFPQIVITTNNNPSPGYLFIENALGGFPPYTMMLDNNGLPVWYRRGRMWDFKQQAGLITFGGYDDSGSIIFSAVDQNFNPVRTYTATNGYATDAHELKVLPDGRYFLIGNRVNSVNMGLYVAGEPIQQITESVVQEFTPSNELIFQWRAWDNYDIRDLDPPGITDFPHMNAIDVDQAGNLVVSARHLSEVTKIDSDTGAILWRLGGAHSSFTLTNDPLNGTSYQHHVSALGNNHYMVFDNGDLRNPAISRAVEYALDLTNRIASMVWEFRDSPDKYAWYCGSAQRLPSGNTLIDFVISGYPKATEVDSNGVKRFELSLVPSSDSYRAFRFPWSGVVAAPYLIAEAQPGNVSLTYNKFGDSDVAFYRIYAGTSPHPASVLAESTTTLTQLNDLPNGLYYFRVTAVNSLGVESAFSNEENLYVNFAQPGQNTILNGTFALGQTSWILTNNGGANSSWGVESNVAAFYVANGGISLSGVQLLQGAQPLVQGKKYVLSFDAWADQGRYIGVQLIQATAPSTAYSPTLLPYLTPNPNHFQYTFTMQQASDFNTDLAFNLGTQPSTVYLKNVVLFNSPVGDLNLDGTVNFLDLSILAQGWLKHQNGAAADLNSDGTVNFNDFNILGANWNR